VETLRENEKVMADLNASQMAQGKRATGTDIRPDYKPLTIALKEGKFGLAGVTDHVTLYNTGSHYQKLYAEVEGDEIEYGSKDSKSESLQEKYGAIYGLTDDSLDDLVEGHVRSDYVKKISDQLGL
jgi:diphthamide synthase (EF-2-diphthine--ammonia ligase)